jgi:cellulose synthase/poly-beta-1,6-N-acetylglucosamine synthase-like glycosyltransferase
MKAAFWIAAGLLVYTYVGYAAWLWLRKRVRPRPVNRSPYFPTLSVVMVVRDEAIVLERKLKNLLSLNYPRDLLEIVVVSDGSTDSTNKILAHYTDGTTRVRAILNPQSRGKASGLNDAIAAATGEIIVFTDARQKIEPDAVRLLAENFADTYVGCASGELMLGDPDSGEVTKGMGLYWRIEKQIREMESGSGSVVGATGAIYAAKRELLPALPPATLLDDVYIPLHISRLGARVVFDSRARAWDVPNLGAGREFARKVRTLSGNYQLVQLAPWLLTKSNPLRFEFVSHKLMRLLSPFALVLMLIASVFVQNPAYRIGLGLQLVFYVLSGLAAARLALGPLARMADAAFTFVILNMAALVAFANFITGRKVAWTR